MFNCFAEATATRESANNDGNIRFVIIRKWNINPEKKRYPFMRNMRQGGTFVIEKMAAGSQNWNLLDFGGHIFYLQLNFLPKTTLFGNLFLIR